MVVVPAGFVCDNITPASSFLLAKRYTSSEACEARQRAICLTGRQPGDRGGGRRMHNITLDVRGSDCTIKGLA